MEIPHVPTSTETVTREWMSRVLADEFRTDSKNVLITDLQVCVGTQRTDGFLSRMQRIIVTAKQKRGDDDTEGDPDTQQTFHLIAKLFPPGEVHQKLVRHLRAFEREIHVYQCHLNLVMSSQDQVPKIRPPFPKIYFCETGLDASCIVMEDLKHSGFKLNDKMRGMDLAHALLCAQGEAILAATAFNAKQRVGVEQYMLDNAPLLLNPLTNHFGVMLDTQVYPGLISFAEGRNREDLVKRLQDYVVRVKSPYVRLMAGVERLGDLAVFSHGDCWNNNYMFRYELDADGNEIPVEVKVLDLQISRYTHITGDLAASLLTNVPARIRDPHMNEILQEYYNTFMSTLEKLGTPWTRKADYTFEAFLQEMETAWEYGFLTACWLLPTILSNDEDIPDFDTMKEDEMGKFFDDNDAKMKRGINDSAVDRILGVLEFGVAKGII